MISLHEARTMIVESVKPLPPARAALETAHGRILREDILAPDDLPAFDRSAMDGYAVIAGDASPRLRVVGEVQPGSAPTLVIGLGECARIFTGAQIPSGATQVIMQEHVTRDADWIVPHERDAQSWIRHRGEDARRGDRLLASGGRLGAGELSLLAQLGIIAPILSPAPRVMHFTTGNELVAPADVPGPGQIRDSNSILVAAMLAEVRARLVTQGRIGDVYETLLARLRAEPSDSWDLLLLSGGASVGDYDFGARALREMGFTIHFRQINLRPGKPLIFATRERQAAFVIPGNPVSHFVTFQVAIRLALECLEGAQSRWEFLEVELTEDLPAKPDTRDTWWPAHVMIEAGKLRARPLAWQSSGDLRGLVAANALLPVPAGTGLSPSGAIVQALWWQIE